MCVESYESLRRRAYEKILELERLKESELFDVSLKSPRPEEPRKWSFSGARPASPLATNPAFFKEPRLELVAQPAAKQEGRDTSPYWYRVVPHVEQNETIPCPREDKVIAELNHEIDRERLGYASARADGRDISPHWYRFPGGDYN